MNSLPVRLLITLALLFQFGCSNGSDVSRFSLKMEGILVGYLDEIKTVYLTENDELLIPLSERNDEGLVRFIGDENTVELSLFLGDTWIGDYSLVKSRSYSSLRIPFEPRFKSILEAEGVRLKDY